MQIYVYVNAHMVGGLLNRWMDALSWMINKVRLTLGVYHFRDFSHEKYEFIDMIMQQPQIFSARN